MQDHEIFHVDLPLEPKTEVSMIKWDNLPLAIVADVFQMLLNLTIHQLQHHFLLNIQNKVLTIVEPKIIKIRKIKIIQEGTYIFGDDYMKRLSRVQLL